MTFKIVCDSREQDPLNFRASENMGGVVVKGLKTGDYSIEGYEHLIAIERKNPEDLFGTLGKGNKRFQEELRRAANMDYFAIIIESSYTSVRNGDAVTWSKMRPHVVVKILWTLMLKYNIHVIFANSRTESASMIRSIFNSYVEMKEKKAVMSLGSDLDMVNLVQKAKRRVIR